jgi:hypothetical protein
MKINGALRKQEKFMMKTKSIALAGVVLAAGSISPALMADNTVILIQNPYSFDVGGEFTAITSPSYTANYAADTVISTEAGTGFSTFCVQTGTDFAPFNAPWNNTTPYDFTLSLTSLGGPGYPGQPVTPGQPFSYALSEGTAYLYSQFAQGLLNGYDYNTGNDVLDAAARLTDAGLLQSAIWELQGGQSYGGYPTGIGDGVNGNIYYNDALNYLGASTINNAATLTTDFGVEIMNLTLNGPDNNYQNQLIYLGGGTPPPRRAPDNGTTLALLALSLAGLVGFSRRLGVAQRAQ